MDYIDEMLQRADPQQISQFLFTGGPLLVREEGSYRERMERCDRRLCDLVKGTELEGRLDELFDCMGRYGETHLELGVRAGAALMANLLLK